MIKSIYGKKRIKDYVILESSINDLKIKSKEESNCLKCFMYILLLFFIVLIIFLMKNNYFKNNIFFF